MPDSYPPQYREMVLAQVRAGRPVTEVVEGLQVSTATVFRSKKQDKIDRGETAGQTTTEASGRRAARQRIVELETELATVKRASELFSEGRVVRPKEPYPIVEELGVEGHGLKSACRLLNTVSSGFFTWRHKPPSDRAIRRAWLTDVIVQTELLDHQKWATRLKLSTAIFDWIDAFYNPVRRHSALGYISPIEFERRNHQTTTAA